MRYPGKHQETVLTDELVLHSEPASASASNICAVELEKITSNLIAAFKNRVRSGDPRRSLWAGPDLYYMWQYPFSYWRYVEAAFSCRL